MTSVKDQIRFIGQWRHPHSASAPPVAAGVAGNPAWAFSPLVWRRLDP